MVNALTPFTFPAGEAHIKGFDTLNLDSYEYFVADVRGHDPQDLFLLALWSQGLDELFESGANPFDPNTEYPKRYVMLPYLPAARADRGVPLGASLYAEFLRDIVVPDKIIVLDPHSPMMPELLSQDDLLIEFPFERIIKNEIQDKSSDSKPQPYVGVIAPDKGAHNRAKRAADVMGVPVYTAGKTRDFETGKLTGFHMEDELPQEGNFLIVDDICDGGGTFIGLSAAIMATNPKIGLDLWVTHGVFSGGEAQQKALTDSFGQIHTTNSYYVPENVAAGMARRLFVHDITPYLYSEVTNVHAGS